MKAANTTIMISAAVVITRAVLATPSSTTLLGSWPVSPLLTDAGHEEDFVVHGEPEEDREHQHRHEADTMGIVLASPTRLTPQPHWNSATTTP